jgi:hypothetical protein
MNESTLQTCERTTRNNFVRFNYCEEEINIKNVKPITCKNNAKNLGDGEAIIRWLVKKYFPYRYEVHQ